MTPSDAAPQDQAATVATLSALLRAQTMPLHRQAEQALGLPGVITDLTAYRRYLARFLGLYDPLEQALAVFPDWDRLGIPLGPRSHSASLMHDLTVLGVDPREIPRALPGELPALPSFARGLGALYVLEGSTLGGRMILRDVQARVGAPIAGATHFFGGRGETLMPMWHAFRAVLDTFGQQQPHQQQEVTAGAEDTFRAVMKWFAPIRTAAGPVP